MSHYRLPEMTTGDIADIPVYVTALEPATNVCSTNSSVLIRPVSTEQFISVYRLKNKYQVSVNFCPESREVQERQLLDLHGRMPDDMLTGTGIGEIRCGHIRFFEFAESSEVTAFLVNALTKVLNVTEIEYRYESCNQH